MAFNKDAIKSIEFSILPSSNNSVRFIQVDTIVDGSKAYFNRYLDLFLKENQAATSQQYSLRRIRTNNNIAHFRGVIVEQVNQPNPVIRAVFSGNSVRQKAIGISTVISGMGYGYIPSTTTPNKVSFVSRIEDHNSLFHPVNRVYNETKEIWLIPITKGSSYSKKIMADIGTDGTNFNFILQGTIPDGYGISTNDIPWFKIDRILSNKNLSETSPDYDDSMASVVYFGNRRKISFPIIGYVSPRSVSEALSGFPTAWRHGNLTMDPYAYGANSYNPYTNFDKSREFDPRYYSDGDYDYTKRMTPYNNGYLDFGGEYEILRGILFPIAYRNNSEYDSPVQIVDSNDVPGTNASIDKIVSVTLEDIGENGHRLIIVFNALVKGNLTFKLSQLPREVIAPNVLEKVDLNQNISISTAYQSLYTQSVTLKPRNTFTSNKIESIELNQASRNVRINFKEPVDATISLSFSNAKNKFDNELNESNDTDYTRPVTVKATSSSRFANVAVNDVDKDVSLYGNIRYIKINDERVKFYAKIPANGGPVTYYPADGSNLPDWLTYIKAVSFMFNPKTRDTHGYDNDGKVVDVMVTGSETNPYFGFNDDQEYNITLSSESNRLEQRNFDDRVADPDDHYFIIYGESQGDKLRINAKYIKENKTQYLVTTIPGTSEIVHPEKGTIVIGKSLLDVPQEVFDRGLISRVNADGITINTSLLPEGVTRATTIELQERTTRYIFKSSFDTIGISSTATYNYYNYLNDSQLAEGESVTAILTNGTITETRNLVVRYIERNDSEEITEIGFAPRPAVAFDKSLVSQVAFTYDGDRRTGTMVVGTIRPITGPIRFNLNEIDGNRVIGFVENELSSDIVFTATGNGETTFTMPLNASHFKIKASDLEKLVFANNQWTAHFKSNITGNVQIDISTVHAEYEDDFLRNTRRSSASRRFSFTLNNSRTSTVNASGWQRRHALYGNIVYAWVGNEQVKFFAFIDDSGDVTLLLPYEKAQELNLIPDLHQIANFNSDGPVVRVAIKGTNGRFDYGTGYSSSIVTSDSEWIEISSGGEEDYFSRLVSAVNDTEKQYIKYGYHGKVVLPEGHPDRTNGLILIAKVVRVNKTEFEFRPKKTFITPTSIVTGKSLFEVPQEIFDKGLIEGFTIGDYNHIDHPVTFKAGLLPADIKRMVEFDVMSNINPSKVLFSVFTYGDVTQYDRNYIENEKLLTDSRELGQHRIVMKVHGGYTEERFINITAIRKVVEEGVDKYYINISPKGVQATQPFSIDLIESVDVTYDRAGNPDQLTVNFTTAVEGNGSFKLADVPDAKKSEAVKKLLHPNLVYQFQLNGLRQIQTVSVMKNVQPDEITSIVYDNNQWTFNLAERVYGKATVVLSRAAGGFSLPSQDEAPSGHQVSFSTGKKLSETAKSVNVTDRSTFNKNLSLYGNIVFIWVNNKLTKWIADISASANRVEYFPYSEEAVRRIIPTSQIDLILNSDKMVVDTNSVGTSGKFSVPTAPSFELNHGKSIIENYGTVRESFLNSLSMTAIHFYRFKTSDGQIKRINARPTKVNKTQFVYHTVEQVQVNTTAGVNAGPSLFDIPQASMKKSLFKTIIYGNGQPPVIEIDSQNITGSFSRYVRTKIYSKVNPNNVIMTIEAEPDKADRYISVNSTLTSSDTSELGDHRMTFELSDGYTEERQVNLSFIENAGLGRYKMTFAAVGQAPKTKKEILFEKVKSEIVGFRREYNSSTQVDDLQLIFKNEQHSSIYIRALNINGLIGRHEAIEGEWDASEWTSEINQLFTDGPYGPFVDIALSQNNTDDNPDDTIWVKFYRLPLTPHQYNLVPTGNESEYGKMLSFTCLRFDTSGNNEISLVVADTADTTTSYSAIPSAAALPSNGRLGDVKVLDTFFPINTKNDTFSSINQSIQVSTTYVGGIETRSFSNLVPPALLSGKYTARGTNVAQLANRILSGMRVLFQLGPDYPKMLVYPVINGNYIDFYPYKVGDNKVAAHPQAGNIIDWLINRGLNNVPESSANGVSRDAFTRPVTGLPTNITVPGEESLDSFLSKIREKINAFNEGTSPRAVRNAYVKEVLSRVGLSDSNLYPLFEQTPVTIASAPQPKIISINDVLHNDLNNIVPTNNPDRATLHPGSIDRNTELDILRGGLDRGENLANTYRDFANKLNDAITSIRNTEASNVVNPQTGKPLLSPTVNPAGTVIHMDGENAFNHRITPATRPTKPAQTSVKPVKQEYNDNADAYNRYLDALKDRYGYNFDAYKIQDTDKFNLARPYVVDMPSAQYGNPEFDKPIDGATPGDLIGFIAEMVYGIQNDRTRNVLETIPGIYIPAVIPAEFRYLGRKDDVIKNQFIRVLNKWIELKPKKGLVREERDAFDALVDELIILSDNPVTQSGLEDGSVYSLSTLFKGSLLNQDE